MGFTIDELIKEAKELDLKIGGNITKNSNSEFSEIEKLANTLESYLKDPVIDYYKEAIEKVASASKNDLVKLASFCKTVIEEGYSEEDIAECLEKTAFKGLVPIISKSIKKVVSAPIKGASRVAFGTPGSRALAREHGKIVSSAKNIASGRKARLTEIMATNPDKYKKLIKGARTGPKQSSSIYNKAVRTATAKKDAALRSKIMAGKKSVKATGSQPGLLRKAIKPVALIGGGAIAGSSLTKKRQNNQPQVTYSY